MAESIRLLIVDDHKFFRSALMVPLYDDPQMDIVAEAPNGLAAKDMVDQFHPDVVLMDVHMPHRDGIQTAQALIRDQEKLGHDLGVVMVTGDPDPHLAIKAIKAGARGYLLKDHITDEALLCAIQAVHAGGSYLEPQVLLHVLSFLSKQNCPQTAEGIKWQHILKPQELLLISDIACGKEVPEIAHENQVSSKTISNRLSRLYNRLGVTNRVQLVIFALRNGLIALNDLG